MSCAGLRRVVRLVVAGAVTLAVVVGISLPHWHLQGRINERWDIYGVWLVAFLVQIVTAQLLVCSSIALWLSLLRAPGSVSGGLAACLAWVALVGCGIEAMAIAEMKRLWVPTEFQVEGRVAWGSGLPMLAAAGVLVVSLTGRSWWPAAAASSKAVRKVIAALPISREIQRSRLGDG